MKIRTGFVSNSSSSSFICLVSGEIESGMDMSLSDFEMSRCSAGHTFCNRFIIDDVDLAAVQKGLLDDLNHDVDRYAPKEGEDQPTWKTRHLEETKARIEWVNQYGTEGSAEQFLADFTCYVEDEQESYWEEELSSAMCPICSLGHIQDEDILAFLLARIGLTRADVVDKLRGSHATLTELHKTTKDFQDSSDSNAPGPDLLSCLDPDPSIPPGFDLGKS